MGKGTEKFAKIAGAGSSPFDAPGSSQNILRTPILDAGRMYRAHSPPGRRWRHGAVVKVYIQVVHEKATLGDGGTAEWVGEE